MGHTTVYHLPNEVLAEIFIQCLPKDPFEGNQPAVGVAPLLLCRICSLWRMIAIHTPHLWTTIGLDLRYACARSRSASGFAQQKLEALKLWSDRMGILPPSISIRRFHTRVLYDRIDQIVSHDTFFSTPSLRLSRSLDLTGFSDSDLRVLSEHIPNFPRLVYLVVKQPGGREHNLRRLRFPFTPFLQRLYFDCYIDNGPHEATIASMFSWQTLTHLCANLEVHPPQWRVFLRECTALEHLVFNIRLIPNPPSPPTTGPNSNNGTTVGNRSDVTPFLVQSRLRSMTIQSLPADFETLFHKTHFPSLISLRLSSSSTGMIPLDTMHRVLSTTPAIRELHLKTCLGFGEPDFLSYAGSDGADGIPFGPAAVTLSTYAPDLQVLVVDGMGLDAIRAMPRDVFKLLKSGWLNKGWAENDESDQDGHLSSLQSTGAPRRRVEFAFNLDRYFSLSIIQVIEQWLEEDEQSEVRRRFDVRCRHSPQGLWRWKQLNVRDLQDDEWKDITRYSLAV